MFLAMLRYTPVTENRPQLNESVCLLAALPVTMSEMLLDPNALCTWLQATRAYRWYHNLVEWPRKLDASKFLTRLHLPLSPH
jgi:hypothetical protein